MALYRGRWFWDVLEHLRGAGSGGQFFGSFQFGPGGGSRRQAWGGGVGTHTVEEEANAGGVSSSQVARGWLIEGVDG